MTRQSTGRLRRIGYLLSLFPKLSETFVLNEVVQVQKKGYDVVPISMSRSRRVEPKVHEAAQQLQRPVTYTLDAFPRGHARALLYWLVRQPLGLLQMFVANQRHPAPCGENKQARFAVAVYTAWLVRSQKIDHLHAHWSYECDIALLLHRFLGIPFSFTAHAHDIFEDIELYERQGFKFADRVRDAKFVIACTRYNRDHLRAILPQDQRSKLHYAYHGLDITRFAPVPRPEGEHTPILLSVGRFVPYKGFDVVVRACQRLHQQGREFKCWLVGPDGSQTEPVRAQIHAAGLDDVVEMLGPQTQEELIGLLGRADVYVNASNPEGEYGVANVIVEALATGLPTIATVRPQVTEYIQDGVNGLLTQYGDDAALASAIGQLLDDRELCQRLATAGRATAVERFSIEAAADVLDQLFQCGTVREPVRTDREMVREMVARI